MTRIVLIFLFVLQNIMASEPCGMNTLVQFAEQWLSETVIIERTLPTIPGKFLLEAETGDIRRATIHCYDAAGCLIDVEIIGHFNIRYEEKHKPECDYNNDGIVNLIDFSIWSKDWTGEIE